MFPKKDVIKYINQRHLPDGGYFFARVEPSSQLETYLAVKTLSLLSATKIPKQSILNFWDTEEENNNLDSISSLFFAINTFKLLKLDADRFQRYAPLVTNALENPDLLTKRTAAASKNNHSVSLYEAGTNTLTLDFADNEAKDLYRLTRVIRTLKLKHDLKSVASFIHSLQNKDGGYGHIRDSHLPTTFYALKILKLFNLAPKQRVQVIAYVKNQFQTANYLEEYFWSATSLKLLKQPIPDKDRLLDFIRKCHKGNGGFARSQYMGIADIEQTYQAVSLLKLLHAI